MLIFSDIHLNKEPARLSLAKKSLEEVLKLADELNETNLVFLGDWFDSRVAVPTPAIELTYWFLYEALEKRNLHLYVLAGNHDFYYAPEVRMSTSLQLFSDSRWGDKITLVYKSIEVFKIEGQGFIFVPFSKSSELVDILRDFSNRDEIVFAHANPPSFNLSSSFPFILSKDNVKVISGHYHNATLYEKTLFVGSLYAWDWTHKNSIKGFWRFADGEFYFVKNPKTKVFFTLTPVALNRMLKEDLDNLRNAVVKLIVPEDAVADSKKKEALEKLLHILQSKVGIDSLILEVKATESRDINVGIEEFTNPFQIVWEYIYNALEQEKRFDKKEVEKILGNYLIEL